MTPKTIKPRELPHSVEVAKLRAGAVTRAVRLYSTRTNGEVLARWSLRTLAPDGRLRSVVMDAGLDAPRADLAVMLRDARAMIRRAKRGEA